MAQGQRGAKVDDTAVAIIGPSLKVGTACGESFHMLLHTRNLSMSDNGSQGVFTGQITWQLCMYGTIHVTFWRHAPFLPSIPMSLPLKAKYIVEIVAAPNPKLANADESRQA